MSRRAVARRELGSLSREKTIVLALLIQVVVAAFSGFLVVGLTSLYDPGAAEDDVAVGVTGEAATALLAAAGETEGLEPRRYDGPAEARAAFDRGEVGAVAHAERRDGRTAVEVSAPRTGLRKTLVVVRLRAALEGLERTGRRARSDHLAFDPLPLPPTVDASPYFGFTYTVLVPLLVFLPVFTSGAVVVDSLTEEIERGTLALLRAAPVSLVEVVDGKAGVLAALGPLQVALWVLLLAFNGIAVANVGALLLLTAAASTLSVVLAAALSVLVSVRGRAQLTYSFGALAAFAAAGFFPEHPATTVALLAIDSPSTTTYAHVVGYAALAVCLAAAFRRWLAGVDAEALG